jgi:hypothetical protein
MLLSDQPCLFCMNLNTARLGLDKKGRPFMHCVGCGARSFLPSFSPCLNGVALLTPFARAIIEEMSESREAYDRHEREISTFLAQLRAQRTLEQTSSEPARAQASVATIHVARPA